MSEEKEFDQIKVGLVCDSGGPFTQMQALMPAFADFEHFYITVNPAIVGDMDNTYIYPQVFIIRRHDIIKLLPYYIYIFVRSIVILLRERPKVLVATGGSWFPVPVFYAGKMLGVKLIFIEPKCRFDKPTLAGRLVYFIVSKIFVRNIELKNYYGSKAEYCEELG